MGKAKDVLSEVDNSANSPDLYEDGEGIRYIGKTNASGHPYLIANEIVSGKIAEELNLVAPETMVFTIRGDKTFLCQYLDVELLQTYGKTNLRQKLEDWTELLELLCFDILILNGDRHFKNVAVIEKGSSHHVCVFDHDRALYENQEDAQRLLDKHQDPNASFIRKTEHDLIGNLNPDPSDFEPAIQSIQSLSDAFFENLILSLDDEVLSESEREQLCSIMCDRRDRIQVFVQEVMRTAGPPDFDLATLG
jgi:hypothetical protein